MYWKLPTGNTTIHSNGLNTTGHKPVALRVDKATGMEGRTE
jgi:hypothetical protein